VGEPLAYSEFFQGVKDGRVESVEITGLNIEGVFKSQSSS
jgi:hypothetical protein